MIARAEEMVTAARQRRDTAATTEADKVSEAAKLAPTQPTFWQRVEGDLPGLVEGTVKNVARGLVLGPAIGPALGTPYVSP
jgi:hypothetical protein